MIEIGLTVDELGGSRVKRDGDLVARPVAGALDSEDDLLDNDAFAARVVANVGRMEWLAAETLARARAAHAGIDDCGLDALGALDRDCALCGAGHLV